MEGRKEHEKEILEPRLAKRDADFSVRERDADSELELMGYKAELPRTRSTAQVVFMCFVLASIPYGLSTTMYYSLANGGPVTVFWGWCLVSLIALCVAISLGEITSKYPTSGGVYYQTFMLSDPSYRRLASWICGWAFLIGNITITLSVNFGTAFFLVACINIFGAGDLIGNHPYEYYLIFLGVTLLTMSISTFGNRYLPLLDTFAIFWTLAGVVAIVITTLVLAKGGRRSAEFVFTEYDASGSGWPAGWSFFVGLLQAAYATSSTGMVISLCDEVRIPSIQVPIAMSMTIVVNWAAGVIFLLCLLFVLPDLEVLLALASGQPVPTILREAVGNAGGAFALLVPIMVLGVICGTGCQTAASRCTWAFSRDGAVPGSNLWKKVHKNLDMPLNAMLFSNAVQIILGLLYFGSAAAFNAFSGVGVICLTLSYVVPVFVSFARGRKSIVGAKFHLGALGAVCNVVAIGWCILAVPLFCLPTIRPVAAETMNYASVVFVAFFGMSAGWYVVWGKTHYRGPAVQEAPVH